MQLHKLTEDLFVAGQLEPGDLPALAAEGIQAIICNRPDGEAFDQPAFTQIEKAAAAQQIRIVYQPVVSGAMTGADVVAFEKTFSELPKPVLAYCRSGTRCTALWSLSEAGKRPAGEIIERARNAGYDMSGLLPRLEAAERGG